MEAAVAIGVIIALAWYVFIIVQMFLGYGTAYRLTKRNGDNGVSLYGWIILMSFASMVPGLGIYLWKKHKEDSYYYSPPGYSPPGYYGPQYPPYQQYPAYPQNPMYPQYPQYAQSPAYPQNTQYAQNPAPPQDQPYLPAIAICASCGKEYTGAPPCPYCGHKPDAAM